jgi:hypothetical protein
MRPFFLLLLLGVSCATLPELSSNQCGNGILEQGEACDILSSSDRAAMRAAGAAACRPPGDPFQCRVDCTNGNRCAAGSICDTRVGICRTPSGEFASTVSVEAKDAFRVSTADLDGDGALDAITESLQSTASAPTIAHLRFFDNGGQLAKEVVIGRPISSLQTTSLVASPQNGPAPKDLLFTSAGVSAFQVTPSRELLPILLPALDESKISIRNARLFPSYALDSNGRATTVDPSSQFVVRATGLRELTVTRLRSVESVKLTLDQLASSASFLYASGTPAAPLRTTPERCGGSLLGAKGSRMLFLFDPGCSDGERMAVQPIELEQRRCVGVAATATVDPSIRSYESLLFAPTASVAHALQLQGDRLAIWEVGSSACRLADVVFPERTKKILAIAPMDSARLLVITNLGAAIVDRNTGAAKGAFVNAGPDWNLATIGDYNGDGKLDVVATPGDNIDALATRNAYFEVWFSGFGSQFSSKYVPTQFPITQLKTGDFDGDGISDLAYAEAIGTGPADRKTNRVAVRFGNAVDALGAASSVGVANEVEALEDLGTGSASILDPALTRGNAPKLGVLTRDGEALVVGGPDRLLVPAMVATDAQARPLTVTAGRFSDANTLSIWSYFSDRTFWRSDSTNNGNFAFASLARGSNPVTNLQPNDTLAFAVVPELVNGVPNGKDIAFLATRGTPTAYLGAFKDGSYTELGQLSVQLRLNGSFQAVQESGTIFLLAEGVDAKLQRQVAWMNTTSRTVSLVENAVAFAIASSGIYVANRNGTIERLRSESGALKTTEVFARFPPPWKLEAFTSFGVGDLTGDGIDDVVYTIDGSLRLLKGLEKAL